MAQINNNPSILRFHLFHLLVFFLFVLISFYINQGGMTYVLFGVFLYLPFIILLTGYNLLLITIINWLLDIKGLNENKYLRLFCYTIPIVPLLIWYFISDFSITIYAWVMKDYYFWSLVILLETLNMVLSFKIKQKTARP